MLGTREVKASARGGLRDTGCFRLTAAIFCAAFLLSACDTSAPSERPPVKFTETPVPRQTDKFANWPMPPDVIEDEVVRSLYELDFELVSKKGTKTGITGAKEVTLLFPRLEEELKFKWKVAESGTLDQDNNSPRREIAIYEIQKLFLDPEDYVVPTSLMVCVPTAWAPQGTTAKPNVPDTKCVLGNISVWLLEVTQPDNFYDEERFLEDPIYAYYMSNFNLLTFLVAHHDGKPSNFLLSKEEDRPHLFAIDNGTSFRSLIRNPFATNWNVIRIPAMRAESIDRLRKIEREDLDQLGVVAELEINDDGVLVSEPPGPNLNPVRGVRIVDGTVQLGLSEAEIDDLWKRIQAVIEEVDSGELPVF